MTGQTLNQATLAAQIARLSDIAGGAVGVAAEHLESGRRLAQHGDVPFPAASTFKVAVAGAVLRQVDLHKLKLDELLPVPSARRVNSDVISAKFPHAGVALSVHNLLEVMLTLSDNTATDVLMDVIGGAEAVTTWLRGLGVEGQRVDRDTATLIRDFFGIPLDVAIANLGDLFANRPDLITLGEGPNPAYDDDPRDTSTPNSMCDLLRLIHSGKALSARSTEILLAILARCATGEARIKGLLPPDTKVAHKTGTIGGTVNDAGIVTLPDGTHLAIAVFVKKSSASITMRERAIAEISRTLYDTFLLTG